MWQAIKLARQCRPLVFFAFNSIPQAEQLDNTCAANARASNSHSEGFQSFVGAACHSQRGQRLHPSLQNFEGALLQEMYSYT